MDKLVRLTTLLAYSVLFGLVFYDYCFNKIQPEPISVFVLITLQIWIIADRNKNSEK
jgi:hypothetical protein